MHRFRVNVNWLGHMNRLNVDRLRLVVNVNRLWHVNRLVVNVVNRL